MKNQRHGILVPTAIALLVTLQAAVAGNTTDRTVRITVDAGAHTRIDTPICAALDGVDALPAGPFRLEEISNTGRKVVPCQIERDGTPRLYFVLPGKTEPGVKRVFELVSGKANDETRVRTDRNDETLTIVCDDAEVLAYRHAPMPPPEGTNPLYTRSGFIHPLLSPSGEPLTRIHPPDHVHHMGLWNPWTKARFEGRHIDFWNMGAGTGTVRFSRFRSTTTGPVVGGFCTIHEHVDLKAPEGEKVAIDEDWDVRVWKGSASGRPGFTIDITSTLHCATESPIVLEKYRYGGLGFRAAKSFDKGDYLTSEGKTRKDGHATRARWCIVHGPTAKGPAGVVFMGHPRNRKFPEPMRIWNNRPEIFFNFCPVQAGDWILEKGEGQVLRYRLFVYDGTVTTADAERLWRDFGEPPAIEVESFETGKVK